MSPKPRKREGGELRQLTVEFPIPPTTNELERMHHRRTTEMRNLLTAIWRQHKPRGWQPLRRFRVEGTFHVPRYCDPLEIWYRAKRHIDAAIKAQVIVDDSIRHLVPTLAEQVVDPENPRLVLTLTELPDD